MPRRVFLGLTEIAGYYGNLARGFEDLGLKTVRLDLSGHQFEYPSTGFISTVARLRVRTRVRALRAALRALQTLLLPFAFVRAVLGCDLFVFGYATTFFAYRELPLLRRLGKRVVFVFHGSDSRAPYLDGAEMAPELGRTVADCIALTAARKRRLRRIERHATLIVANPLSTHLHERPVLPFLQLGIPTRSPERRGPAPAVHAGIRVLHAPSQPSAKGTAEIRAAVERLRARGVEIELEEVAGVPNAVVLGRIAACDFVVDQVYSDTPMAGFSVEAAAQGKPSVVGGYGWNELEGEPPPTRLCRPDELEEAIEQLATDGHSRRRLGERAHAFVTEQWTPRAVAERLLGALDGGAELYDPTRLLEHRGAGLSEDRARQLVAAVIEAGGREALQLSDKPALEQRLVEFSRDVDDTPGR